MNIRQNIYIDESGTPVLNDECYAICAVACNEDDKSSDEQQLEIIRKKHRGGAELKSSAVGGRSRIREAICQDLAALNSRCIVFIVRKKYLHKDGGFPYKKSAYKYCQRRLFEKVYRGLYEVKVTIDSFGNEEFMDGFKKYINKHFQPSIFNPHKHLTVSSPADTPMLQIADFVAGTVRRFAQGDDDETAYKQLEPILSVVEVWPRATQEPRIEEESEELDLEIERHCTNASMEFLESTDDDLLREALEYLLYSAEESPDNFVCGDRLLDYLKQEGLAEDQKDKAWLQQKIIAPLRDQGVPVAASRDGYKIPRCRKDLSIFVDFVSQKTLPYLKKVNNMRNSLFLGLGNQYDMLDENNELKDLMTSLSKSIS